MASGKYIECTKSELDLFSLPMVQTSMLKTEEVPYKPIASLDNATTLEFLSVGQGDTYRDLSNIFLKLSLKIIKGDGNNYADDTEGKTVGITNNFLHSLFRQVTVYLGNKAISVADNNYAYRAMIESLLSHSYDSLTTHSECSGFYQDKPAKLDHLTENKGLDKRKAIIKASNTFELIGRLHCDILNQQKYMLNNVDVRINLSLQTAPFYMLEPSTNTSKVKLIDATLYINHITISPSVLMAHENVLARSNAFYPYTRVEVKSYTVAKGSSSLSLDNIVIGQLPNFLLFCMVKNEAYTGSRANNPFNFQHFNLSTFYLSVNGSQVPLSPLTFDFTKTPNQSLRAYSNLFKHTNMYQMDRGNQLSFENFNNGCFLLAFDLTSDLSASEDCANMLSQGTIRTEGQFSKALDDTITCLVYMESDAVCEISRFRNVYTS